jgi:hypothetical protein
MRQVVLVSVVGGVGSVGWDAVDMVPSPSRNGAGATWGGLSVSRKARDGLRLWEYGRDGGENKVWKVCWRRAPLPDSNSLRERAKLGGGVACAADIVTRFRGGFGKFGRTGQFPGRPACVNHFAYCMRARVRVRIGQQWPVCACLPLY